MCLPGGGSPPPPPPLPPAPPPPLPPAPTAPPPDPIQKEDMNAKVRKAKQDRGKKNKGQYKGGTGDQRVDLDPNLNPQNNSGQSGGLN